MLKLAKASEGVITIDDKGDITFTGYYQEESLGITPPGEFQIAKGGDPKLDSVESICSGRDITIFLRK